MIQSKEQKHNKIIGIVITYCVIILLFIYLKDGLFHTMIKEYESIFVMEDAKTEKMTQRTHRVAEGIKVGTHYGNILCERIQLSAPLYYGDSENILDQGVGTYIGYGVPGQNTTILTGAHDGTYYQPLEKIQKDDVICVETYWGTYHYKVRTCKVADVLEEEAYKREDKEVLIMYTCYPFQEEFVERSQRFYVYAERIEMSNEE